MPTLVRDPRHKSSSTTLQFFQSRHGVAEFALRSRISKVLRNAPRTENLTEYPTECPMECPANASPTLSANRFGVETQTKQNRSLARTKKKQTTARQHTDDKNTKHSERGQHGCRVREKNKNASVCSRSLPHVQVPTLKLCAYRNSASIRATRRITSLAHEQENKQNTARISAVITRIKKIEPFSVGSARQAVIFLARLSSLLSVAKAPRLLVRLAQLDGSPWRKQPWQQPSTCGRTLCIESTRKTTRNVYDSISLPLCYPRHVCSRQHGHLLAYGGSPFVA